MAEEQHVHEEEVLEGEVRERPELPPEVRARREAALRHVVQWGDPVLKSAARPVESFDDDLRREIAAMGKIMEDALGIGLAATQVGRLRRLLVYRVEPAAEPIPLVNPVREWASDDEEIMEEGCLSLPAVLVEVERPVHVRVRAQDEWGDTVVVEASGLEARVIQHEMDHLDGVLILERTTREQRKEAMRAMREALEAGTAA